MKKKKHHRCPRRRRRHHRGSPIGEPLFEGQDADPPSRHDGMYDLQGFVENRRPHRRHEGRGGRARRAWRTVIHALHARTGRQTATGRSGAERSVGNRPESVSGARVQQIEAALNMWQQAQAGRELAQKTFDRVKALYEQGVVPAQKFDEAQAQYNAMTATASAAKAQYDLAVDGASKEEKAAAAAQVRQAAGVVSEVESYLSDAMVYSPVTGEISTIIAEQGELVGSGYPVVAILDMSDMWVTFNIKETLMPKIRMGMRCAAMCPHSTAMSTSTSPTSPRRPISPHGPRRARRADSTSVPSPSRPSRSAPKRGCAPA